MTPTELRKKGYQALVDALGQIDTIRFLQQTGWGVGDYTKEREQRLNQVTREEFWQDVQRLRARKASEQNIKGILRSDIMQESAIYQEIYQSGELKGKLEGELATQIKIALNLLKRGLSINEIVEITGLSLDLVQGLTQNHQNN